MGIRLQSVLWCTWLSGLLLSGVNCGLVAAAETPTAVVYRLIAAISQAETTPQGQLVRGQQPRQAFLASTAPTLFDLPGLSQRLLGQRWAAGSAAEQHEFITLLTQLLAQIALPQSAGFFRSLEMTVTTERLHGQQAVVHTTLRHPSEGQIGIDYVLGRAGDAWRIHDVMLDGVSLAANLRAQFHQIIARHSYAELLRRMREKLAQATLQATR